MKKKGYKFVAEFNHYPEYNLIKTVDRVFVKKENSESWNCK